jgi:hypothetical protein
VHRCPLDFLRCPVFPKGNGRAMASACVEVNSVYPQVCYRRSGTIPKSPVLGIPIGGMSAPRRIAGARDKVARAGRPGSRPGGFQLGFILRDRFR